MTSPFAAPDHRGRAACAHRAIQNRRHRIRRTRRADSDRPRTWPRPDRPDIGGTAPTHPGRIGTPRGIRPPSPRGRAGRAHSRREGILGSAAATLIRDAGAATRYRDRGRTGAGTGARRRRPRSPVAHRRSRHRLRRNSAGAAVRIAGGARIRDRHFGSAPCIRPPPMRHALGCSNRATFVACDYASGLSGPFDLIVSNPPYIRTADIAGLAVEVRESRSAGRTRWRRRRTGRLPRADSPGGRPPRPGRSPCCGGRARAKAAQIEALMTAAGLMPVSAPKADLAGIPRAVAGHKMAR